MRVRFYNEDKFHYSAHLLREKKVDFEQDNEMLELEFEHSEFLWAQAYLSGSDYQLLKKELAA